MKNLFPFFPSRIQGPLFGIRHLISLIGVLVLFSACAPPHAYTVRLSLPLVPADLPESGLVIGVVGFEDARGEETGRKIGERTDQDGKTQEIFLGEESVPGAVTTLFKSILRQNDFIVSDIPAWRPAPDGSPAVPSAVDAVISGRIERLSTSVHSRPLTTKIVYNFRIVAEIGAKGQDRVVVQTVSIEPSLTRPGFSQATLERMLNQYLSDVLQRLADELVALKET